MRNKKRPNCCNGKSIRYYKDVIPTILIKNKKKEIIKKNEEKERNQLGRPELWVKKA